MAPLRASCISAALLAGGTALGAGTPDGTTLQISDAQPIQLEARSSDFDYKNNTLLFHGVRIAQGGLAIESEDATATGLDFKSSHWRFHGSVKITVPGGELTSDEARIDFEANLISTAEITGAPARFEQRRDKSVARGRAAKITYLPAAGTVRLAEDAWLSDGNNEISGQTLIYNMRDQRVIANPDEQGNQRVRITINPKKPDARPEPKADGKPEPKPMP